MRAGAEPELPRTPGLALRIVFFFALTLVIMGAAAAAMAAWLRNPLLVFAATIVAGLPLGLWLLARMLRPTRRALRALREGVRSFRDRDYSMRLTVERGDEVGDLVSVYNEVGDTLQKERNTVRQKEVMLETVLQTTPMGLLLVGAEDRIEWTNRAARDIFLSGASLGGRSFADLLAACPPSMREAFESGQDALFTVEQRGEEETYHLAQREFHLSARRHRLYMIKRLTPELRRQEVEIWKKVIRVISHELNNSLAPISSLSHSGRLVVDKPEELHRLAGIFETIEERATHLKQFLEGYSRFARLPRPRGQRVEWSAFLQRLSGLSPFGIEGPPASGEAVFDPSQMEQVILNLLKNARESGSPEEEIRIRVESAPGAGSRVQIMDRGTGMSNDVMRQALLPFYTSKPSGTGLGLPLSREIVEAHGGWLRVENRDGGGCIVTIWLPPS